MPRSTARVLHEAGYEATDVRDIGRAGHKDPEIFARAQAIDAVLVTADLGFANLLLFPLGSHAGIVVTRTPNRMSVRQLQEMLLGALQSLNQSQSETRRVNTVGLTESEHAVRPCDGRVAQDLEAG